MALLAIFNVARNAPALTPELRSENVYGDWRVPLTSTLFHRAEYDFQIGFSLLQTDAALMLVGYDGLPTVDVFEENMRRADALFQRSLSRQPGHAATWSSLVWTRVVANDFAGAIRALEVSLQLAPNNVALAPDRLAAVGALDDLAGGAWLESNFRQEVLSRDLTTLSRHDPAYFQLLVDEDPAMREVTEAVGLY